MSETRNIYSIPDEILVHIFHYLKPSDAISVSQVCLRFERILTECRLLRNINFSEDTSPSPNTFKTFFKTKIRCINIQLLNITDCYWFTQLDICNVVRKLHQLHTLYAAGTKFNISSVSAVLKYLPKLRRLSLSICDSNEMSSANSAADSVSENLALLEVLYLQMNEYLTSLSDFSRWLGHCKGLQELWIVGIVCKRFDTPNRNGQFFEVHLPLLHTLVLDIPTKTSERICGSIKHNLSERKWKIFWISNDLRVSMQIKPSVTDCIALSFSDNIEAEEETYNTIYPRVTHLSANYKEDFDDQLITPTRFPNVKHFLCSSFATLALANCIMGFAKLETLQLTHLKTFDFLNPIIFRSISSLNNLSSLSLHLDSCEPECLKKHDGNIIASLHSLVSGCPNVSKFSLMINGELCRQCLTNTPYWTAIMSVFANWTNITTLTLENVHVADGSFFTKLCDSSPNVLALNLINIGISSYSTFSLQLSCAINCWKQLKLFRLQQDHMTALGCILTALAGCPQLEFVALNHTSVNGCESTMNRQIIAIVSQARKLAMLYICVAIKTTAWTSLVKRQLKPLRASRPSLVVLIINGKNSFFMPAIEIFKKIPLLHRKHFTSCDPLARVCIVQPTFYSQQ